MSGAPVVLDWYFDVLSPFARIQLEQMDALGPSATVRPRPVLLGAILKHWGQLGPAEIAPKRLHTYRLALHVADQHGLRLRFPPRHPFNPLGAMRLLAGLNGASGPTPAEARTAMSLVWDEGEAPDTPEAITLLAERLGADQAVASQDASKGALRSSTDEAIARGVFGVPTFALPHKDGGHDLFWGVDAFPMLLDALADPALFTKGEMARAETVEEGVRRG